MGACVYHHLRCIHAGYLKLVVDTDTGEHRWYVKGMPFTGGVADGG